jgi:hypothetical protein
MRQLPTVAELKETGWWMLALCGAFALVYDLAWYGEMIARSHG